MNSSEFSVVSFSGAGKSTMFPNHCVMRMRLIGINIVRRQKSSISLLALKLEYQMTSKSLPEPAKGLSFEKINSPHSLSINLLKRNYSSLKQEPNSDEAPNTQSPRETSEAQKASSTFYSYTQALNTYGDLERNLMKRIHENNTRRFRITLGSLIVGIAWFVIVFGEKISNWLRSLTTGLALETLEDKSIKIQTQELAMAVVQTVLNDKQVTAQAAAFLREAAQTPETQDALLKLTLHVLQHPNSIKELTILTKQVIAEISKDKVSLSSFSACLTVCVCSHHHE
jgi:hypothetical protein